MRKSAFFFLVVLGGCLLASGCKKDDVPPHYSKMMARTTWQGTYYNKSVGLSQNIPYTLILNADSTFEWQDSIPSPRKLRGVWKVSKPLVQFAFVSGNRNKWTNKIEEKKLPIASQPDPDNFLFHDNCIKKP